MSDETEDSNKDIVHRDEYLKPYSLFPELEELAVDIQKIHNQVIDDWVDRTMKAAKTNPYKNHWDAWLSSVDTDHVFHQPVEIVGTSLPWDDPNSNPIQDMLRAKEQLREAHYSGLSRYFRRLAGYEQKMLEGYEQQKMKERKLSDSVAIVSGGLDSTTLVYDMIAEGYTPHLLSFNYGQRHAKELQFAAITAKNLGLRHDIVDLTGITHLISNSALTSQRTVPMLDWLNRPTGEDVLVGDPTIEVPDGHYAEETMKATVVPNRNMIMLSIAAGVAVNNKYRCIATGVHAGDHFIYPDCRPNFIYIMRDAILTGNEGFHNLDEYPIVAPFLNCSKADIAYRAIGLGVPLHLTWSCYKGGEKHCGRCGTCVERLEAIDAAIKRITAHDVGEYEYMTRHLSPGDRMDQTAYEDTEFWKTAVV